MTTQSINNFVDSFDTIVKSQYQSKMKLRPAVRVKTGVTGKSHTFYVINKGTATRRVPQTDVVPMNVGNGKAVATLEDWNAPDYLDEFDMAKLSYDEKRALIEASKMAVGRRMDQLILDALAAGANASNEVSDDVGGTNTGMNLEKIVRSKRLMDEQGVPPEDRHMVCSARSIEQALLDTEITSRDYNLLMPLMKGEINTFSGFTFHMIEERGEGGLDLTSNIRTNFAFHKDAVGLAVGIDMKGTVDWVAEKTSWLMNTLFSANSVVIDDLGVYNVKTYEA